MNPRRVVYYAIQVAGVPFVAAAYGPFVRRLVVYARRSGASATVLASFYPRWLMHRLGTRRDAPCARLMRVLPNVSPIWLRLLAGPTLLGHRLTGYVEQPYRYPYTGEPPMVHQMVARTTYYDAALARHLPRVDQLVVLGAGLDTRSYRLPADVPVRCFEVDAPRTQAFKRAMLRRGGVDARRVTFVAADFEREDWFDKLVAAGFDPDRPAFFLWESVTMYLDRGAVVATLRRIAGAAPGGAVAFDYFSTQLLEDRSIFSRYTRAVLAALGEPFGTFGVDNTPPIRQHAADFLADCGLTLEEHRTFGRETARSRALAGFAVATVRPRTPEHG